MPNYTEKEFKSILNVRKYINDWFWDKYSINPYNGCFFDCIYCDSRSEKYYLPKEFESDIVIKKDAAVLLDKRLKNGRTLLPDVVAIGGTTDPYQPAEMKYRTTRKCLEVLLKYKFPVHICTKSDLVVQDLELISKIAKSSWSSVSFTITTLNPEKSKFLEKNAPSPQKRLEAIKTIKCKFPNINTGILLMPVIPYLTDFETEIEEIVKNAKEAGADFILFGPGMTMRDKQAVNFLKHLKEKYPLLIPEYEKLFRFTYKPEKYDGQYNPLPEYSTKLYHLFLELCKKYSIQPKIKRFIPDDYRKENYRISELLFTEAFYLQAIGKPADINYWIAQTIQALKEPITNIIKRGDLRNTMKMDDQTEKFILQNFDLSSPKEISLSNLFDQ